MEEYFRLNNRLGIELPSFNNEWDYFSEEIQHQILLHWETIRGSIPDRISDLEGDIDAKQAELDNEMDFQRSCQLNSEIADLASVINDLWLWFRTHQNVTVKAHY